MKDDNGIKTIIAMIAFLFCAAYAAVAAADMQLFPLWEEKQCPTETFACYSFEKTKSILKLDLDLQLKLKELTACDRDRTDLSLGSIKLEAALATQTVLTADFKKRLQDQFLILEDTTKELKKANDSSVWNYVPWIIGGVVATAAATFALGWYVGGISD